VLEDDWGVVCSTCRSMFDDIFKFEIESIISGGKSDEADHETSSAC
jgi:hypothetical protein